MKKIILNSMIILLFLSSCSKESNIKNDAEVLQTIKFEGVDYVYAFTLNEDKTEHIIDVKKSSKELLLAMEANENFVLHVIDGANIYMYKNKSDFAENVKFEVVKEANTKSINGLCVATLFDHGDATGQLDQRAAITQMWINGFSTSAYFENHEQENLIYAPGFSVPYVGSNNNDKAHILRMEQWLPSTNPTYQGDFHVALYEHADFDNSSSGDKMIVFTITTLDRRDIQLYYAI